MELDALRKRIEEIRKLGAITGLASHSGFQKALNAAAISGDPKWLEMLEGFVKAYMPADALNVVHPFLPGPSRYELPEGQLLVGFVNAGRQALTPFKLPLELLPLHTFVAGGAGSGKSYLLKSMVVQLIHQGLPVWIFDTEDEYKDLIAYLPDGSLTVFNMARGEFKANFLQGLPGETPIETLTRVKRIFREQWLRDGAVNLLGEIIFGLYTSHQVFQDSGKWPTVADVYNALRGARYRVDSRRGQYAESAINRVRNIMESMSDIYDVVEGFDLPELTNRSVCFRLAGLSRELQLFFMDHLLSALSDWKLKSGSELLEMVVVLDEAHRFFTHSLEARMDLGEPIIWELMRVVRKRGVGVILASQSVSDLPVAAIANVGTRIILRTVSGQCLRAISFSMSLSHEQVEYVTKLNRQCVVSYLGYNKPFLVNIPPLDFGRKVAEEEIRQQMTPILESFRWIPKETGGTQGSQKQVTGRMPKEQAPTVSKEQHPAISKEAAEYLVAISEEPFLPATVRDRRVRKSLYKGSQLRKELREAGLVQEHKVTTGKKGRALTLLEITTKGYGYLSSLKVPAKRYQGKGSFIHCFWQAKVKEWAEKRAWIAAIEDSTRGKFVDVAVYLPDGQRTAYEVCIEGEEKELSNVVRDVEVGFHRVVICAETQSRLESLRAKVKELGEEYVSKAEFALLTEFL